MYRLAGGDAAHLYMTPLRISNRSQCTPVYSDAGVTTRASRSTSGRPAVSRRRSSFPPITRRKPRTAASKQIDSHPRRLR
ncbi:hypothetical protein EVAR_90537_1 [Eumeta japonica]|uniref:Uncharacterized protein n=1 Tax=Eumeta variegata TaxID=151549 RepID=A0A4C1XZJ6_EUMVA|nr:hypothetical protein EVAR_90537_1 [Eumeta japonica]